MNTEPLYKITAAMSDILSEDSNRVRQWLPLHFNRAIAIVRLLEDGKPRTSRQIADDLELSKGVTVQLLNAIAKGYPALNQLGRKTKLWSITKP
jgi:hypothetical protein